MIAPGSDISVTALPGGEALNAAPHGRWRHPWFVTPRWTGQQWVCTIKAGTVNGKAPGYRTYPKVQEDFGFGFSPLDGHAYFSDAVFNPKKTKDPTRPIDIPLYQSPAIELQLRPLGIDGAPDDIVPSYFLERGVQQTVALEELAAALERGENIGARAPGTRLLRAADLILHQPRAGLHIEITINADFNGVSNVSQKLTIQTADPGDALRVFSGHWQPPSDKIDPLAQIYDEPNYDELHLATVFLVSPPDADPGSDADGSWLPYVKHEIFWPLTYQAPPPFRPRQLSSGALLAPFVGGLAQPIINFFTAAAGDAADMALNWLQAQSNKGNWWTATGGGSDAEFPVEPVITQAVRGLDRAARIQADIDRRRAQQAATLRRQVLDPSFPYRGIRFVPSFS